MRQFLERVKFMLWILFCSSGFFNTCCTAKCGLISCLWSYFWQIVMFHINGYRLKSGVKLLWRSLDTSRSVGFIQNECDCSSMRPLWMSPQYLFDVLRHTVILCWFRIEYRFLNFRVGLRIMANAFRTQLALLHDINKVRCYAGNI